VIIFVSIHRARRSDQEAKMALLRQCLQQLRLKQHDWEVPGVGWPEDTLHGLRKPGLDPHRRKLSQGLAALPPALRTDRLHVGALHG
jgi:hypothetical protein